MDIRENHLLMRIVFTNLHMQTIILEFSCLLPFYPPPPFCLAQTFAEQLLQAEKLNEVLQLSRKTHTSWCTLVWEFCTYANVYKSWQRETTVGKFAYTSDAYNLQFYYNHMWNFVMEGLQGKFPLIYLIAK